MRQEVEKDQKRKKSEAAKHSRKQSKQRKTNDTSVQAKADYAQHNGPPIADAPSNIPQNYLQNLMLEYYQSKITVTQKADELEQITRYQGAGDSISTNVWLAERRKQITSSAEGQIARRRSGIKVANLVKT